MTSPTTPQTLSGKIGKVQFTNPANGWSVLQVYVPEIGANVTCVGNIPAPTEGTELVMKGEWVEHRLYGKQWEFAEFEINMPTDEWSIIRYLSTLVYGVGEVRAQAVYQALGDQCLSIIQQDPSVLFNTEIPNVTDQQKQSIVDTLVGQEDMARIVSFLAKTGVTPNMAARILREYGSADLAIDSIKKNPYVLIDELWGVGFKRADQIAMRLGIPEDSHFRLAAAIKYILKNATNEGHCYLRPRHISHAAKKLLGHSPSTDDYVTVLDSLYEANILVREEDNIYLYEIWRAETSLAQNIAELVAYGSHILNTPIVEPPEGGADGIIYAPEQTEAIRTALNSSLSIITGGPGTGKTTVTLAIVDEFARRSHGRHIHLVSPTGRASKRLSEATGREAMTIHRLLGYTPEGLFTQDRIEPGLVIVDEFSMADIELAHQLFRRLNPGSHQVVLVGDVDQLPSVGPGSVLRDAIISETIPTTRLIFNYRQGAGSSINLLAQRINEGELPAALSDDEITAVDVEDRNQIPDIISHFAAEMGEDLLDWQILTPMKKGVDGVHNLNAMIRDVVNPNKKKEKEVDAPGGPFRSNDKVMVIKNNYTLGVFNGDLGIVVETEPSLQEVTVLFPDAKEDRFVVFGSDVIQTLQLAYASTVHKAQGSEFRTVVAVCTQGHYIMLRRNLLYTAVSRAKRRLILIHQLPALRRAAANNEIETRFSDLEGRLRNLLEA